jgi:hypothetical protein
VATVSKFGLGLAQVARLSRRQLITFAILSAVINGLVTAGVGSMLAQSYASYQRKNEAVQRIADLVYERRIRARMASAAIRRKAEPEEVRYRKRAYDEAFVEWNKKVQQNIFRIRDISGEPGVTRMETQFQDLLVPALSSIDRCLTKAYDSHIKATGDDIAILDACRMDDLHQFVLDCGATFTNELDRLMRASLASPWGPNEERRLRGVARIDKYCGSMPKPLTPLPALDVPQHGATTGTTAPGISPTVTPVASPLAQNPVQEAQPTMLAPGTNPPEKPIDTTPQKSP